jgi:hypothetical protein
MERGGHQLHNVFSAFQDFGASSTEKRSSGPIRKIKHNVLSHKLVPIAF